MCGAETDSEASADFPFCSERCRLQDLGNWSSERYKISSPAFDEDEVERLVNAEAPEGDKKPRIPHGSDDKRRDSAE